MAGIVKLAIIKGDQVTWAEVHNETVPKVVVACTLTVHSRVYDDGIDFLNELVSKRPPVNGAITPGLSTERLCVRLPVVEVMLDSRRVFFDSDESGCRREFIPNC